MPELPIRVLIVDRDAGRAAALTALLEARTGVRFEVVWLERLADATAALRDAPFHAVLADLDLDDSRGLPTLAILLTYAGAAPVIVLSDSADDPTPLRALQQGARDHLPRDQLYGAPVVRTVLYAVERSRTEVALRESQERYRMLFQQSRDAIYMSDLDRRIVEVNRAALELFGYRAEELIGAPLDHLFSDPAELAQLEREVARSGAVRDVEVRLRTGGGRTLWCLVAATERRASSGALLGWQGIIHDITARKDAELRLEHVAMHDALTGLPTRTLFMDRLEQAIRRSRRAAEPGFAVLLLDLDRFKSVNDTLGHEAGDRVLRRTADLLRGCVRDRDALARLGGDEFVVVVDGIDSIDEAAQVANRMLDRLNRPYRVGGREYFTTVSIGITWGREGALDPAALVREADVAMYRAKALGGARYRIFDAGLRHDQASRLETESDLRQALDREQLMLHYQPILSLATGRTTGYEALARWNHPIRGLLLPDEFIPLAEATGLVVPLGRWALQRAVRQLGEWRELAPAGRDVVMSVNLSPRQFVEPDLVDQVGAVLDDERVPPHRIRLELTETALMHDPAQAATKLRALRDLGVGLCLDDFGTGYSSLSYLRMFPLDTLKVDRSFVGRVDRSAPDRELVATITGLARNLGIQSVAEGVETAAQLTCLRQFRPHEVQGFLFSRPLEPAAAALFLGTSVRELDPEPMPLTTRIARRIGLRADA
jgi:diguanylate cyclase (GGDEF)-like protein/PAS domain S-box-containing protein